MKVVGLNIDRGRVAATVVETGFRTRAVRESFVRTFTTDAELIDLLREKAAEWAGARIVSAVPGRFFAQRPVELPFSDRKRVEKALPFEVEDAVPFPLDDVVLDHILLHPIPREGSKRTDALVLAGMLPKQLLKKHLDLLRAAGIDPHTVVPSFAGLIHASRMLPGEGDRVLMDNGDLCFMTGHDVTACRSLSWEQSTAGLAHTLKAFEAESGRQVEKAVLLRVGGDLSERLAGMGIAAEAVFLQYEGKSVEDPVSFGITQAGEMNFRKGEFSYRLADVSHRRQRRTLIAAGSIAALLAAVNMGVKWYLVQSSYGRLDREIREIYRQAVPDAKAVADPMGQLRAKLTEARKRFGVLGTGTSALDVMKAVTEGVPAEVRVSFQEFNLEGDRLKLQGDASSFESVDKIKAALQKAAQFSDVAVQDTRMGVDNKVKFRFEIKLKQQL